MSKNKQIREQKHNEHEEVMPFISEDSVQDRLLVFLAIVCGISLCMLLGYWCYLPADDASHLQGFHKMAR